MRQDAHQRTINFDAAAREAAIRRLPLRARVRSLLIGLSRVFDAEKTVAERDPEHTPCVEWDRGIMWITAAKRRIAEAAGVSADTIQRAIRDQAEPWATITSHEDRPHEYLLDWPLIFGRPPDCTGGQFPARGGAVSRGGGAEHVPRGGSISAPGGSFPPEGVQFPAEGGQNGGRGGADRPPAAAPRAYAGASLSPDPDLNTTTTSSIHPSTAGQEYSLSEKPRHHGRHLRPPDFRMPGRAWEFACHLAGIGWISPTDRGLLLACMIHFERVERSGTGVRSAGAVLTSHIRDMPAVTLERAERSDREKAAGWIRQLQAGGAVDPAEAEELLATLNVAELPAVPQLQSVPPSQWESDPEALERAKQQYPGWPVSTNTGGPADE